MLGPTATITSTLRLSTSCWRMSCSGLRVRCGVGHHEAGAALGIERGVEQLDPQVVGVVAARQAEREAAALAHHDLEPFLVQLVDVERRIGQHEVELAGARKSVGEGKSVAVRVDLGGVRHLKKKN